MQTYSIANDYQNESDAIAIVPIKSFVVSEKYSVNKINIYPSGTLNVEEIRGMSFNFNFEEIKKEFYDATIITFPITYQRLNMLGTLLPSEKEKLINKVLGIAEDVMNTFRFISSNFDKASNLPQRAGYINDITSGLLIYYPNLRISDYICDKYYVFNKSLGEGLYIEVSHLKTELDKYFTPLRSNQGEVGNIIKHAFRLYSDILYLPTATNKFMQAMSLIEYLSNPFEYEKMQKVKSKIVPYSAESKSSYHDICERFKYLTSLTENGVNIGLRTSIIHTGKTLEQIITNRYEIDLLLRELQTYICNFINGVIKYCEKDWNYVEIKIQEKYDEIQKIKSGYEGKFEADTAIIIDFEFLNLAIREVFQIYPKYKDVKFNIAQFISLLLIQADIERKNYQIPVQLIYKQDVPINNSVDVRKVSQLEGLGFNSSLGEVSIYTFDGGEDYDLILEKFIRGYLIELNYNISPGAKFTKIVWISDRNKLDDEIFIKAESSCKKILLGRLDNKLTTCYDKCTWFDIQLLIMKSLGIEYYEECTEDYIFKIEDARYEGA
ncbi:hypothetical protein [Cohnella sp.]|uniref:hypothetical protein n=1 Tax=Cohnella sp. TaxID=1883426 RepID=UPI003564AE8B